VNAKSDEKPLGLRERWRHRDEPLRLFDGLRITPGAPEMGCERVPKTDVSRLFQESSLHERNEITER